MNAGLPAALAGDCARGAPGHERGLGGAAPAGDCVSDAEALVRNAGNGSARNAQPRKRHGAKCGLQNRRKPAHGIERKEV